MVEIIARFVVHGVHHPQEIKNVPACGAARGNETAPRAVAHLGRQRLLLPLAFLDIFGKPGFDERLIGHVAFIGFDLDAVEEAFRQPQRDGFR